MKCAMVSTWVCLLLVVRATFASQGTVSEASHFSTKRVALSQGALSSTEQDIGESHLRVDGFEREYETHQAETQTYDG